MILGHSDHSADSTEPDRSVSPVASPLAIFQPAPTSLDPATQASQNLQRFKAYLEDPQSDGEKFFPVINESFSSGLTFLRSHTNDRQSQLDEAKSAASDFDKQEAENRAREFEYRDRIRTLKQEEALLKIELDELQKTQNKLTADITIGKSKKKLLHGSRDEVNSRAGRLAELEEDFAREAAKTIVLQSDVNELKLQVEAQKQQLELALETCEARVRELTLRARNSKADSSGTKTSLKKKKLEPLLLTPDVSAYVIDDRVRISGEDTERLQFMITELEKENEELTQSQTDKMADIDCLMQENLGLKQLIRQLTEG